MHTFI